MGIAELFTSIFGGGLTGLVGAVTQRVFEYKAKQLEIQGDVQKYAHEVEMRKADAAIMAQEWAAKTKVAETEAAGTEAVADSHAFAVALTSEPQRYSDGVKPTAGQAWLLVLLDVLRGIVRPGLTIYLCAITTLMYLKMHALLGNGLPAAQVADLVKVIINTVLYLTTTCVLFWFGTRNSQKGPTQ